MWTLRLLLMFPILLAGCASGQKQLPQLPSGVKAEIQCRPQFGGEYPRIAITGDSVYVATAMGQAVLPVRRERPTGLNTNYSWLNSPDNQSDLSISADGTAILTDRDPTLVDPRLVLIDTMRATAKALTCRRV